MLGFVGVAWGGGRCKEMGRKSQITFCLKGALTALSPAPVTIISVPGGAGPLAPLPPTLAKAPPLPGLVPVAVEHADVWCRDERDGVKGGGSGARGKTGGDPPPHFVLPRPRHSQQSCRSHRYHRCCRKHRNGLELPPLSSGFSCPCWPLRALVVGRHTQFLQSHAKIMQSNGNNNEARVRCSPRLARILSD